jgi:hypothetical protein
MIEGRYGYRINYFVMACRNTLIKFLVIMWFVFMVRQLSTSVVKSSNIVAEFGGHRNFRKPGNTQSRH